MNYTVASVVVLKTKQLEFDYAIPKDMNVSLGMRVLIDFRGYKLMGVVTRLARKSNIVQLKPIIEVLDSTPVITDVHFKLAQRLSRLYPYGFGEFIFMMLPGYAKKPRKISIVHNDQQHQRITAKPMYIKADRFIERYAFWRDLVKDHLKHGSVLVCFPQLSYVKEAVKVIEKDFPGSLKVLHSYQSEKELFRNWSESRCNSLIVGTRIALMYFPRDVSLLIIEEENSPYYFQEEKPYHRVPDVAFELSKLAGNQLVLAGSYPTLKLYSSIEDSRVSIHELNKEQKKISVVEIRDQTRFGVLGPVVLEIVRKYLEQKKKIVIIWNKRGYGFALSCTSCAMTLTCEHCSSFLRLHLDSNDAVCPYCARHTTIPKLCTKCNSGYFRSTGLGIEKVTLTLRRLFPEAVITTWEKRSPTTQIIISTAKIVSSLYTEEQFDCGILLDIDAMLARLDYNAGMNAFIYAKTLSLFFKEPLFVVTRTPSHYLFSTLPLDWHVFYKKELSLRKDMHLPPFWSLAKITMRAVQADNVEQKANALAKDLTAGAFEQYGPFKEIPFKVRGKFYYSLILKSSNKSMLRKIIKDKVMSARGSSTKTAVVIE